MAALMNKNNNHYLSLAVWPVMLIVIGAVIGSLTKPDINTWYSTLNRSSLRPPNYVFPVAWTITPWAWFIDGSLCLQ